MGYGGQALGERKVSLPSPGEGPAFGLRDSVFEKNDRSAFQEGAAVSQQVIGD
jgi:hypothetical protein